MLRRLATLALTLSLASTAAAQGFAKAPVQPMVGERIRADVTEVPRISDAARAKLRKVLKAHRAKNVASFRAYAKRGVYPHNFNTDGALNVWIDQEGHMCAAATMIFKSGAKSLVRKTGRDDNFIRLGDVTSGPLLDWILTSGLTQTEVATIQEPFMGRPNQEPGSRAWRLTEDARLRARYTNILASLDADPSSSLDAAIDALATHPDLVAKLLKA
jgi:hypothetical protein